VSIFRCRKNGTKIHNKKEFCSSLKLILGFKPKDLHLYETAFIHRSATHEYPDGENINNERLEYLGDAVLDTILSEFLFEHYPVADEGQLTKLRSRIANRITLNKLAVSMGINTLLISHVNKNIPTKNLYGDALEALIGAVFLDKGYDKTKKFIIRHLLKEYIDLKQVISTETDFKSQVYQWAQKLGRKISFSYREKYDPDLKASVFTSTLRIDHELFGEGRGSSKKEAEQEASVDAWKKINKIGFIN